MSDIESDAAAAPITPQALALALAERYDASAHPQELLALPEFEQGVALLCDPDLPVDRLIDYLLGSNHPLVAMAAEALARREDGAEALSAVWAFVSDASVWALFFLLRVISRHARGPMVAPLLLRGAEWWPRNPILVRMLNQFVGMRVQRGEHVDLRASLDSHPHVDVAELDARLACLKEPPADVLRADLQSWQRARVDASFLSAVGRLWPREGEVDVIEHRALSAGVDAAVRMVTGTTPQSLLVVGDAGVGKTALVRALGTRLRQQGWQVFQASAADVMAGQTYIGELENRLRELVGHLDIAKRVLWYVPAFQEMYHAGRHRYSPVGALDILLPAIERGEICVVGEIEPQALEKLLQQRPRLRNSFRTLELEAMSPAEAEALASRVLARDESASRQPSAPEVVKEAIELARQYLANRALPGSVLELLRETLDRVRASDGIDVSNGALSRDALLVTLSRLTGLPASVLDDRAGLDPAGLRRFFQQRVMGQPEAVDCLVDRIAMLKAGLTDPARPVGVFLFAGPTGTGKTEVAKSLAQFLFGSVERMIRLDMSEFQESGSLSRIVGDTAEGGEATALTNRIRKQPFSVVLLDEFEKAHPRAWDLFLQVFDDGRLTDAQGNLADFRHSIIILTTNVGATEHQGASLGFTGNRGEFAEQQVARAVSRTFRPEFVNRLDRVIVFRPLSKSVMRDILKKELRSVLQRRGLRNRDWAVEWEESAIDFLLEKGFTQDMGARPLRRAIDRYVLAPIANTIVEHRAPQGDQFLFVRAGTNALEVEFVDPDATEAPPAAPPADALDVRAIILSPAGTQAESLWLQARIDALAARLEGETWRDAKEALLRQMQQPTFWEDAGRHQVLQRIECMDAIEAGGQSTQSLMRRLASRPPRTVTPRVLVRNVAQQVYLLEAALLDFDADVASDAFLSVEAVTSQGPQGEGRAWARRLVDMYLGWGRKRHLRVQILDEGGTAAPHWVLSVAGLGACRILSRESGLHVMESADSAGGTERTTARVAVVTQSQVLATRGETALALAMRCLEQVPPPTRITRRYRPEPSPLVRDVAQGTRTGRLDAVLAGDFDLLLASSGVEGTASQQ